jgi:hypothetical protein
MRMQKLYLIQYRIADSVPHTKAESSWGGEGQISEAGEDGKGPL